MRRSGLLVAMMVGALALAGCSRGDGTDTAPTAGPTPGSTSGNGTGGAQPTPEPTAPPVGPGDGRIRSAAHPDQGYDRIVFDFDGPLPGYTVRYVDQVRQDGSGNLVDVPGRRYLLVVHAGAGPHRRRRPAGLADPPDLDYPMMRGYALVGDFEAQVSVAVGLDDVVGYRVGELPGQPGRIYLDAAG